MVSARGFQLPMRPVPSIGSQQGIFLDADWVMTLRHGSIREGL